MRPSHFIATPCVAFLISASCIAQTGTTGQPHYFDPSAISAARIIGPPPSAGSPTSTADHKAVLDAENGRSTAQVTLASADDLEQDIFIFAPVVGNAFKAATFPQTAALSSRLHADEGIATAPLKSIFARPRPYQADKTVHPVCKVTDAHTSYPSGHALGGYLYALVLIEMLPERREAIMARADEYAHNRIVCGVHYPSDVKASQTLAYVLFGNMLANPQFQSDLRAARDEVRSKLNLPTLN